MSSGKFEFIEPSKAGAISRSLRFVEDLWFSCQGSDVVIYQSEALYWQNSEMARSVMVTESPLNVMLWVFWLLATVPAATSFSQVISPTTLRHLERSQLGHHALLFAATSPTLNADFAKQTQVQNNSSNSNSNAPNDESYLRWNKEGDIWKMQTAVTSFQRDGIVIDLHAQVHFADAEYFDYYNSPDFTSDLDHVHYELLVDQELLEFDIASQRWRLKSPIMASPNDQNLANSYGWTCQASQIDYTQPKWIHADMTRQEFLKFVDKDQQLKNSKLPLWKLASPNPQSSSAAAEAVSALLVGPPQLSSAQSFIKRRLFTNLFLPGSRLANALRALLWMSVPAPELSVILLDWSSVLTGGGRYTSSSSNRSLGGESTASTNPSGLSKVAWPIFSCLARLDVTSMRRFFFGQVLLSSDNNNNNIRPQDSQDQAWSFLVTQRNDHALQIINSTLKEEEKVHSALLYGSSHCPDLHNKLVADGFTPIQTSWRTAWSVQETTTSNNAMIVPALTILLVGYLAVGALDWVGMMGDASKIWLADGDHESYYIDAGAATVLYLVRHVLLYLGLSKFLVDWTNCKD